MESVFQIGNFVVLPFWLLMILLPHWQWSKRIIATPWVAALPAILYAVLIVPQILALAPLLANPQLDAIAELLGSPQGATLAWLHFLAFDLFVGRWIYRESRALKITAWITSPVLVVTLLFGPLGFLLHLIVRWALAGRGPLTVESAAT